MTKTEVKHRVVIRSEYCKGCGLCIEFCKKKVLVESTDLNKAGYHYAEPARPEECTGCMVCTMVCPDVVIEVYDE